jgi:hypothetical protein
MTHESYKAWLDAMPIDDVRRKMERLERKLADLQVLERLHAERHGGGETEPDADALDEAHDEPGLEEAPAVGEAGPSDFAGEAHDHEPEHSEG